MENHNFGSFKTSVINAEKTCSLLKSLSVLEVSGADAETFLHGQFTNHIKNLGDAFRLAAYCQPQGRILALMRVFKKDDRYYLIIPCDLVAGFVKRLSMFILRSKVQIRVADDFSVIGLVNPEITLPETDHVFHDGEMTVARVADWGSQKRAVVIGKTSHVTDRFQPETDEDIWFTSEIKTGTPWVFKKTKEAFIPQWINLELVGGLVFDKGCYPGQEIISRMQHIGSTPRRMILIESEKALELLPGDDVFEAETAVGKVVMSSIIDKRTETLASVSVKSLEARSFLVKGVEFQAKALPYALSK